MKNDISQRRYKMMIASLKVIPAIMAVSQFMGPLCAYLGVGFQIGTHYLGLFLAPMMYLYMSSIVFKFCWYHRIFIWYMLLSEGLTITDWYFRIPISNEAICMVQFAIAAAFVLGVVIYYIIKYVTRYKDYFIEIYRRYRRQ